MAGKILHTKLTDSLLYKRSFSTGNELHKYVTRPLIILKLLRYYDVNIEATDIYGNTPLLKACYCGSIRSVEYLLHFRAKIDAINFFGQSSVNLAIFSGELELVKLLLSKYSYENFYRISMISPIVTAELWNKDWIVSYLLEHHYLANISRESTVHGVTFNTIRVLKNRRF